MLNDLLAKAETEVDDTRRVQRCAPLPHAESLEKAKAERVEHATSAAAEHADLAEAGKSLAAWMESQAVAKSTCAKVASDHEASLAAYSAELEPLAEATQVLQSATCGATDKASSLFQSGDDGKEGRSEEHPAALAQLASRISAIAMFGAGLDDDPLAKVKGSITNLIDRLQKEASSEASHKSCGDEETAKATEKKGDLET